MDIASPPSIAGISFVLPCLNEEASVGTCVREALACGRKLGIPVEVVVVDNGSSDQSALLAEAAGARVISYPEKGYGAALLTGMREARFPFIITADTDGQHQFSTHNVQTIANHLAEGADFVNGNRFHDANHAYRLPLANKFGNTLLSISFNLIYGTRFHDVTCGMNGHKAAFFQSLHYSSRGMELNIEIRAKNALHGAVICEADIDCINRMSGRSHVRLMRDGFLHLLTVFRIWAGHRLRFLAAGSPHG